MSCCAHERRLNSPFLVLISPSGRRSKEFTVTKAGSMQIVNQAALMRATRMACGLNKLLDLQKLNNERGIKWPQNKFKRQSVFRLRFESVQDEIPDQCPSP